jgi:hypothetical protein
MTATKGSPMADIARTSIILKYGEVPDKMQRINGIISFIRNKFYKTYINHYLKITGTKLEEIHKWELPVAAARLTEWLPQSEKSALLSVINMKLDNMNKEMKRKYGD